MLYPIQNDFRNKLDISGIWDFQIDESETGEAEGWFNGLPASRPMAVPGSWNEQYEDLFNYFGLSWYVKRTYIPNSWKGDNVYIRVGSACYFGTVYVNGVKAGSHEGGHLPFAFDISELVNWGAENVIAISVENHLKPTRVPSGNLGGGLATNPIMMGYPATTFDFFPFAGLHRPVVLYSVPQAHITDVTVVTEVNGDNAKVKVNVEINGQQDEGRVTLAGEKTVEAEVTLKDGLAEVVLDVPSARLWSDKDPYLYDLTITTNTDRYSLKVGIRTIEVQGGKILLNGKTVELNGFGRHEDFFASGKGLNLPLMVKDYQLMRWTGANSYRTSHYPYSEEEMMLADREGFLIIDEIPAVSLQFDNAENMAERYRMCIQQIDELVTRDKNHPSVVMWSVANEPMPADMMERFTGGKVDETKDVASTEFLHGLVAHARKLDPTRPITIVGVMGGPTNWLETCDVACINRYWGWYMHGGELDKGIAMIDQELDALWDVWQKPIIVAEFGTDTQPGLHGLPAVMWTEEYQVAFIRGYLEVAAKKDFVAGMQVWNFADFAAVQSIARIGGMNMKGVFTRTRQPKMAAHTLREFWVEKVGAASNAAPETNVPEPDTAPEGNTQSLLEGLASQLNGKKPDLTTTLKFDFHDEGIYRLIIKKGACHIEPGDGEATATMRIKWKDAQKLFAGKLDPMVAIMTGKIKSEGDARAFMILQDAR
ncbi:MAG: beta-glucuronidase [Anaerolineae bacterium]|jgi:beta-glucuronidase|nr:beta-glucuronidase [Anaerolineae bacterium]MBT7072860.1 beta-glucuronidase [Anaerolineae bacterium]MBT7326309.1 beta-glucuronidase [Anaerolineae bacterium]